MSEYKEKLQYLEKWHNKNGEIKEGDTAKLNKFMDDL